MKLLNTIMKRKWFLLVLLLLAGWTASLLGEVSVKVEEKVLTLIRDGEEVAVYRGDLRLPCIYPLHGPTGTNVTRHFPLKKGVAGEQDDHPHHVSFWMAHGAVGGADFWHGVENRIETVALKDVESGSEEGVDRVSFTAELAWRAGERLVLTEVRTYLFGFSRDKFTVDVRCALTAGEEEVLFGDTKEGMFAIRVTPSLRLQGKVAKGNIRDSEGRKNEDCWGKRSRWVASSGPDAAGKALTIALMDHPQNLRHPTWWHARDYGLLAANPFGQHDFEGRGDQPHLGDYTLEASKSLTQGYRLVLSAGEGNGDELAQEFAQFQTLWAE